MPKEITTTPMDLETGQHENPTQISVVCISDLHNLPMPTLPPGDILIVAGDLSEGQPDQLFLRLADFTFLTSLFQHIILIAGNHDRALSAACDERGATEYDDLAKRIAVRDAFRNQRGIIYLENSGATITVRGRLIKIWGSPGSPSDSVQTAFGYTAASQAMDLWGQIPVETDILVTHVPPQGYLDDNRGKNLGCPELTKALWRVKPLLHVFGHIHAGYGRMMMRYDDVQREYENRLDKRVRQLQQLQTLNVNRGGTYVPPSRRQSSASIVAPVAVPEEMEIHEDTPVKQGLETLLVNAAMKCGAEVGSRDPIVVRI